MKKTCNRCKLEKKLSDFNKCKKYEDGVLKYCKACKNEVRRKNRLLNKDARNQYQKKYFLSSPEQHEKNKKRSLDYYNSNIEKFKQYKEGYEKNRSKIDKIFFLRRKIKNSINAAFKRKKNRKNNRTEKILGCTFYEFKKHIESIWEPWMSWDNYGKYNGQLNYGWDLDHIIPICEAKNEQELIKLNHYTNFQPLCSKVNRDIKKANCNDKI